MIVENRSALMLELLNEPTPLYLKCQHAVKEGPLWSEFTNWLAKHIPA